MIKTKIAFAAIALALSCLSSDNVAFAQGPGTEMTQIINRLGLGANCGRCQALAAEMDQNGSAWVMQNRNYVANRTISNAENLGHRMGVVRRAGVRAMIRTSVRRAR
ncbi:hypothetical protein N9Y42_07380 [Mariniblastus sp.]|nr:hypothetical protein [Mariniblastus sp.]